MKWTETRHCRLKIHCVACRSDRAWREQIANLFEIEVEGFDCPHKDATAPTHPLTICHQCQAFTSCPNVCRTCGDNTGPTAPCPMGKW